jgi:hypothetical protein
MSLSGSVALPQFLKGIREWRDDDDHDEKPAKNGTFLCAAKFTKMKEKKVAKRNQEKL